MPALDCRIPEEDWIHQVERTGIAPQPAGQPAATQCLDAGPWEPTVQRIVKFQHLGDDWDGLGATAPSRELLASAVGLAYLLCEKGVAPPPVTVPGLDGAVIFIWQEPDGTYADIEIERPLYAEVMVIEPGKPAKHWTFPTE